MQYFTEDGCCGFLNCDERVINSKAKELASKFFTENTNETTYSIVIVDFEKRTHDILEFTIERNITVSKY